jgi:nucleotide-binding universal stress UspA family protein
MNLPTRILVATDFSPTSTAALAYAVQLAIATRGEVTLMHAYELPIIGLPEGALLATAEVANRLITSSEQTLAMLADAHSREGVRIKWVLRQGVPHEEVQKLADEMDADLIVVGTHARKGLQRFLLGSVAEKIIRTVERPILTIHGPRDDR